LYNHLYDILGTCPIILDKFGVSRTYKKAVNMVVEDFKNNGFDSNYTFYISHAFNGLLWSNGILKLRKENRKKYGLGKFPKPF